MARRWRAKLGWMIALPYLISFVLPFERSIGAFCFVWCLLAFIASILWLLIWLANPFLWAGLWALRAGRWDRAAILGVIACLFASLPLVRLDDGRRILPPSSSILSQSSYFTWLASMVLLAGVGSIGWASSGFSRWPQVRLRTLMMAIAYTALLLALARVAPTLMSWLLPRSSGIYMGTILWFHVDGLT
jgi:hypothetical protein